MAGAEEILFGWDRTPGVVAVEVEGGSARLYRRAESGIVMEERPFHRWLLTTEQHSLGGAAWTELEGDGFRYLAEFDDREAYQNARYWLRDAHASHISLPAASKQFLIRSGVTLFKETAFEDVVRLQLDIETLALSPERPESEVFIVSITDNRGFETQVTGDETRILLDTVTCVRERDPDIIEGHSIIGFDLPYLAARAKLRGVTLAFGRDGSEVTFGSQQSCAIGYFSRPFIPAHIHGRQVIDTLLAVQRFDVGKASLSSHSLKAVAESFGIAEPEREIIPHDRIASEWKQNPDRVLRYAMQDAKETRSLAEIVCPPEFYLAEMVPETYALAATTGTGEKINSIFMREYLRRGRSIPQQSEPKTVPGGWTDVCATGVIERIVKCDVESLYPSIMLTKRIKPERDTLGVFLPALDDLTQRRMAAKKQAKESQGRESAYWDGLQSAFKILINSFYGYLGGPFNFNDYDAAAQVTITGQAIVKQIVAELERTGSTVVEVDTDGVYFQPPAGIDTEDQEIAYVESIGAALPEGIRLAHDGRYRSMISLKIKNYVLAGYDGEMIFRGSSLRSRADERFGAEFISKTARLLLHGKRSEAAELYESVARKINAGELGIDKFSRRERVTPKTFESASRKRMAQAVGEAKIGDYILVYQRADGTIALAKDYDHDEDRDYLLDKLYKFACRLREAFGDDFDTLFPRPSPKTRSEAAGQQRLDLFEQ